MKVILKQDVENLGRRGDVINVSAGYGRNFLIPKKLALQVTASNVKIIEIERQALKKKTEQERLSFQTVIQKLDQLTLTFSRKAGEKDVIFGSVSAADIKEALEKQGYEIDRKKIILEEPIKRLGNFTVPVKIYHDDRAQVKVAVVREEAAGAEAKPRKEKEVEQTESESQEAK